MKLTLLFASILAVSCFCAAAPSIQERCGSNATITSQSSFIGDKDHELQIITASCPDRRRALGSTNNVDRTERDTCLPDPASCFVSSCLGVAEPPTFAADCKMLLSSVAAFTPTFTVLQDQVIFIIFNTCQLDFGVGPQTTGICGSNWVYIIFHELQKKKLNLSSLGVSRIHHPVAVPQPGWRRGPVQLRPVRYQVFSSWIVPVARSLYLFVLARCTFNIARSSPTDLECGYAAEATAVVCTLVLRPLCFKVSPMDGRSAHHLRRGHELNRASSAPF
ncbi:hypothetical protein GGX14DRAFT_392095 [Mycena pura]|uniref:Uncharacterized protein n=1 Tax=Mycena pura TaxID=153505 RepID=A0AAD6YJA2_9AGAR|nr:hypothetical protein GGX14DRAFT_392095 [Mycena pura]